MRARVIGAVLLVFVALGSGLAVRYATHPSLAANEAIAVVNPTNGIRRGTPVVYGGVPGRIGRVERVEPRGDKLVLRLRFDSARGIVRRRGDAVSIWSSGGEKIVAIVGAPAYEKARGSSDTLFLATSGSRRPADVQSLLSSLYRPGRRSTRDSTLRR